MNFSNLLRFAARLTVAAVALGTVAPTWALGLGELDVQSHLNEPLAASIRIIGSSQGEAVGVRFGDAAAYQRLGLSRPRTLEGLDVFVEAAQTGNVVRITGQTPVTELIIDLVIVLTEGDSEQVRHYPLLLDFPAAAPATASAFPRRAPRPSPAPSSPAPTRQTAVVSSGSSYGPVQPGDTLGEIASRIRGNQPVRYWALVEALFELNPDAFVDNDIDKLKVGAVLQVPSMEGLVSTTINRTRSAPSSAIVSQPAARVAESAPPAMPRRPSAAEPGDSRLEIIGTPNSAEILNSMSRLLEHDDPELAARGQQARAQLAFATAEIQTYRHENEQLRAQVRDLEARVADLNRLIELRAASTAAGRPSGAEAAAPPPADAAPGAEAGAPAAEGASDAMLTVAANGPADAGRASQREPWYYSWLPWTLALGLLLAVAGLMWLRGQREIQKRQERTADLVNRIRQAADRAPLSP